MAKSEQRRRDSLRVRRLSCVWVGVLGLLLVAAQHAYANDEAARAMRVGDYEAAARALRDASVAGDVESQYQLGALYRSGRGVEKDHREALRWFTQAAQQGHSKAQYHTGIFHLQGWGTEASVAEALRWLELAALQGHPRAIERVRELDAERRPSSRSAVAQAELDPAESEASLRRAIRKGDAARVETMIRAGYRPPAAAAEKRTLVHDAVDARAAEIIRLLTRAGAPADRPDEFGETPLMLAARSGQTQCVGALHEARVDLDQRDPEGRTALMLAAQQGRTQAVALLIRLGARPELRDHRGFDASALAKRAGHASSLTKLPRATSTRESGELAARRLWIERSVSNSSSEYFGWPPITVASLQDDPQLVKALADAGADLDGLDPGGQTALMRASSRGRARGVGALLRAGASTGAPAGGATPICLAAQGGHTEVLELLLQHGASPRSVSAQGSPLLHALEGGHSAAALRLLEAGAAPARGSEVWLGALEIAAREGDESLMRVLSARPGDAAPQQLAASACSASDSGNAAAMRLILELGAEPTTRCSDGLPLLARFASTDSTQMLRLLLALGADTEQTTASGNTPLQLTAHAGRADWARVLIDAGAEVGARGAGRTTALMAASQSGQIEVVELLLERGADEGDRNAKGQTARQLAELAGHQAVVAAIDQHESGSRWFGSR